MSQTKRVGLRRILPTVINSHMFRAELNRAIDELEQHEAKTGEQIIWATIDLEIEEDQIDDRTFAGMDAEVSVLRSLRFGAYATVPGGEDE